MLHLAVPPLPRDFGGVEDCLFRCSPIDNLITLCQVKSNCPEQWKSQESHLCHHSVAQTLSVSSYFHQTSSSCLPSPWRSISSRLNAIWAFYWITISESRCDIFFSYILILTSQPFQSSLWIKCVESETGSPLKYSCCNIISYQKIKSVDK